MKIESAGKEFTLGQVEDLPEVEEPNSPKCAKCSHPFMEPREGDICIVCPEKAGKAPPSIADAARAEVAAAKDAEDAEDAKPGSVNEIANFPTDAQYAAMQSVLGEADGGATDEQVAAAIVDANATVSTSSVPPRPSLDVAIETHGNLVPRIEALCSRLLAWDVSKLGEIGQAFGATVREVAQRFRDIGSQLSLLRGMGFVAKTSAKSRRDQAIAAGTVALSDATKEAWSQHYTAEELARVSIVAIDGEIVWVSLGNRPNPMPIPLKRTQLIPA